MATIKLFEAWLQSQEINEVGPGGTLDFGPATKATHPQYGGLWTNYTNEIENREFERIKSLLKKNGIIFGKEISLQLAGQILVTVFLRQDATTIANGALSWLTKTGDIKLMDSPENPDLVLTTGIFAENQITEIGDDSASSDYYTIAKYCNNAAILKIAAYLYTIRNQDSTKTIDGAGIPLATDPNTGTLTWEFGASDQQLKFYGTAVTTSAQSKQVATTTTWEVPATGKTIVKTLPGTMFETGQVTLANSKELDQAIAELKALLADKNTKLASIEIESSASGDRPAADGKSGYPATAKPGQYPLGKPYIVQKGETSGNAKLAFGRGETIKQKLAGLSNNLIVKAVIQDGGDAAQYAKLTVTVQKVDKPTEVLSKTELETILLKPKQTTNLASAKTLSVWNAKTASNLKATYTT